MAFMRCKGCNSVLDPEKVKKDKNNIGQYCMKGCKIFHEREINVNKKLVYNKFNNFNCARIDE